MFGFVIFIYAMGQCQCPKTLQIEHMVQCFGHSMRKDPTFKCSLMTKKWPSCWFTFLQKTFQSSPKLANPSHNCLIFDNICHLGRSGCAKLQCMLESDWVQKTADRTNDLTLFSPLHLHFLDEITRY